jgi:hypothetical protein
MSTLTHDECRGALLNDDSSPAVTAHLEHCEACARFAAVSERMRDQARALRPGAAPAGLAERVIEAVRPEASVALRLRGRGKRNLLAAGALAAAVALVVGAVTVLGDRGDADPEQRVLLAAAQRTEDTGGAEISVEGEAAVTTGTAADGQPDLSGVPEEMYAELERRWAEMMAEFERNVAAFEAQLNAVLDRADQAVNDALAGRRPQPPPPQPPAAWAAPPPPAEQPQRPDRISVGVALAATGHADLHDVLRLAGTIRSGDEPSDAGAGFDVAVADDVASVRTDTGWTRVEGLTGPLGTVLLRAGALGEVLRSARGDVVLAGRAEVDGVSVRHYRFAIAPPAGAGLGGAWRAEAWVDDDLLVRRLAVHATGVTDRAADTRWSAHAGLTLSGFGPRPAGGPVPTAAPAPSPQGPSLLTHPFGPAVARALER